MANMEELKRKLNELNDVLTQLPENAAPTYFNNSYNVYDKYEGDKSGNKIIGKKHSFSLSIIFDEIYKKEEV